MKRTKLTYGLLALMIVVVIALIAWGLYLRHGDRPTIAYVDLEQAVTKHPSYGEYEAMKAEYGKMEANYRHEQQLLTLASQRKTMKLQQLSLDDGITMALNEELQAKLRAKETELNGRLQAKYKALYSQYEKEWTATPTTADLEIVNLQLAMVTPLNLTGLSQEDQDKLKAERAEKEARLQALLKAREPAIQQRMAGINAKVQAAMVPYRQALKAEFDAYAKEQEALFKDRQAKAVKAKLAVVQEQNQLPDPEGWNARWSNDLQNKQDDVKALHDAILEDIRHRADVIRQEKHLDIVLQNIIGATDAVNITDEIVATYGNK